MHAFYGLSIGFNQILLSICPIKTKSTYMFSCYRKKPQNNNNKTKAVDIHIILKKEREKNI